MSDLTAEEFVCNKISEQRQIKGEMRALWTYKVSGEDALRWAHEFSLLKANGVATSAEPALHKHFVTNSALKITPIDPTLSPQIQQFLDDMQKAKEELENSAMKYLAIPAKYFK